MTDEPAASTTADFVAGLADKEYKIDPKLVSLWSDLALEHRVDFKASRYEFDFIFAALQRTLQSQVQILAIITASLKKDGVAADKALRDYSETVLRATNDVRRFMTAVMQDATGAQLDDQARVVQGENNGE